MATLGDLAERMRGLSKKLEGGASAAAVEFAEAVVKSLAWETPVDTSRALSNWQVSLGAPIVGNFSPYVPGKGGSSQQESAIATINAASLTLRNKKPGQAIYVFNNLPYIRRLNDGYSAQAPAGFVEAAILRARVNLRNKIKA